MPRKHFTTVQIISKLREAEVLLSQGKTAGEACKQINVSEQTYYKSIGHRAHIEFPFLLLKNIVLLNVSKIDLPYVQCGEIIPVSPQHLNGRIRLVAGSNQPGLLI